MRIKYCKNIFKMTIAICMLCLAGLLFFNGCSTLSTKDADLGKTFKINEVDQLPKAIHVYPPKYPFSAAKERIEGKVVVRMVVDSEGRVKEPEVFKSEPEGVFDEAAMEAVGKYEFKPAVKDGKNVDCIVHMPLKFTLGQYDKEAYNLADVDQRPKPVYLAPPKYPFEAQTNGIAGKVVVRFVVAPDGKVYESEVVSSEPEGVFDEAALAALAQSKFQPALKDDKPVSCIVKMPLKFDVDADQSVEEGGSDGKVMIKKEVLKQQ